MNAAASFENILNLDTILAALLVVIWGVAGYSAGRLAGRRTLRGLRAGARRGLGYLLLGLLLALARAVLIGVTASYGWDFAADRILIIAPVLLLPAVAVVLLTAPRLFRLARLPVTDRAAETGRDTRREAASPMLVLPVHATAVGAVFGLYFGFINPVAPPILGSALFALIGWLLLVALLHTRQVRRQRRLGGLEVAALPRPLVRMSKGLAVVTAAVLAIAGSLFWSVESSRLPARIDMGGHHAQAAGGGGHGAAHAATGAAPADQLSVPELVDRSTEEPARRFTLVAQDTRIRLASGKIVDGKTFNGQAPGPELRVRQGELIEVTLVNRMAATSATIHWHGINVPNAADGVPGVTQDAVQPGQEFVYRFRINEVGTHWYHTHQDSAGNVSAGLFGALLVEPREGPPPPAHEIFVPMHGWPVDGKSVPAFGTADLLDRRAIQPGTKVRLRVIDTDVMPRRFVLDGTPFKVTSLDGTPVNGPTDLTDKLITLGSGGRADLEFTMPDHPVRLTYLFAKDSGLLLSPDGTGDVTPVFDRPDFDFTTYGTPTATPFGPASRFDREYTQLFDSEPGFYDGKFAFLWTTNGKVFPDVENLVAREGELIKVKFVNRSRFDHPMHLHGHKMLVLSRGGRPVTGSPVWLDTLDVDVGEEWEIAFRADNPGIWMDHCHNFLHAQVGMMLHLTYENVTSPYQIGPDTPNNPS
ncbi:multicopper oxidase family protein [Amycolatopsis nigrescens]|uniref:multicopper oxidase family protein n=1 Tax=Amycolatopsis nigrescens TaxID=381445 RepID=UPI00036B927B|nr:multicopper oxidase family protein [Amycolatopsis nigrescens]